MNKNIYKGFVGEMIGTFLLVLFGIGSVAVSVLFKAHIELMHVALAWGFGVMLSIYLVRGFCNAHLNPAVSIAMVVSNRMSYRKLGYYILAQFIGAIFAGQSFCYYLVLLFHLMKRHIILYAEQ